MAAEKIRCDETLRQVGKRRENSAFILDRYSASGFRHLPLRKQPYIVELTAHALTDHRERCNSAGMDDHLTKPLLVQELVRVLEESCNPG